MADKGPGRYTLKVLPRKSKLRGKLARLAIRQANTPSDKDGLHYIKAGSMRG